MSIFLSLRRTSLPCAHPMPEIRQMSIVLVAWTAIFDITACIALLYKWLPEIDRASGVITTIGA